MPDLRNAVRRTLEAAEAQALELLTANRLSLDALAQALFTSGYLDRVEIDAVLAGRTASATTGARGAGRHPAGRRAIRGCPAS